MDPQEVALIEGFLEETGYASLFEYHGLTQDSPPAEVEAKIKERRAWAQTQQANPKYRSPALWLIKNHALVRRVLLEERDAYIASLAERDLARKIEQLDVFLAGSMAHGQVSPRAREALRRRASDMGLTDEEIDAYIGDRLTPVLGKEDDASASAAWDPYAVLGVRRDAELQAIEQAYRSRYRWARSLRDLERAQTVYQELDRAWRDLSAPERRAAIDAGLDPDGSVIRVNRPVAGTTIPPAEGARGTGRTLGFATNPPAESNRSAGRYALSSVPPDEGGEARFGDLGFGRTRTVPPGARAALAKARAPEGGSRLSLPTPALLSPSDLDGGPAESPAPQLQVDVLPVIQISTWFRPGRTTFHVTNEGGGPMPGTLASSQPWVTLEPRTLDPDVRETEVEITFWPRLMPGRSGTARLSVTTTHGERRVITVKARKRAIWLPALGGIAVLVGLLLLLGRTGVLPVPFLAEPEAAPGRTHLALSISPPADAILIDGAPVGSGARLDLPDPADPGRRILLRVEHRGCLPWEEGLVLADGQRLERQVTLQPDPAAPGGCS